MDGDLIFWLALIVKMIATAGFVCLASWAAERAGPLVGAMVATLPLSAGPSYVFLALDHDAAFIAASARASLAANAANAVFCFVHVLAARRLAGAPRGRGTALSVAAALAAWALCAVAIRGFEWSLLGAVLFSVAVFLVCVPLTRRARQASMPPAVRRWYDVPLRAGMVATLVAVVLGLSRTVGPVVTGVLALFPIVLLSLVLIFQPRIGGPGTAALTANAIFGLIGFCGALAGLCLTAEPLGVPMALTLALAVSIGWNVAVALLRRRRVAPAQVAPHTP
jgi:hypothetical protein